MTRVLFWSACAVAAASCSGAISTLSLRLSERTCIETLDILAIQPSGSEMISPVPVKYLGDNEYLRAIPLLLHAKRSNLTYVKETSEVRA